MKKNVMTVLALLTVTSIANASGAPWPTEGFEGALVSTSSASLGTTFFPSETTDKFDKQVVEAKEDIAYFVSSEGQVRTARFENALSYVKQNFQTEGASDLEIASEILATLN